MPDVRRGVGGPPDNKVETWPHLLILEFLAALVFTVSLVFVSVTVNAPLETLANPEKTPNPSKAPWYFLNLQELLLHMDPALAGVIVPTVALIALAAIPYFDDPKGVMGEWFLGSRKTVRINIFSGLYTAVWVVFLIFFDKYLRGYIIDFVKAWGLPPNNIPILEISLQQFVTGYIYPLIFVIGLIALLVYILRRFYHAERSDLIQGLFTGFVVTYVVLTIVGTAFRGHGMELFWPWEVGKPE